MITISMSKLIEIELRLMQDADFNFIKNSYMKSYRNSYLSKHVKPNLYNNYQSTLFDRLMADSSVLIACNPSESYQILGYAIYNNAKKLLHYVYVKNPYRKNKIAKRLVERIVDSHSFEISHLTPFMKSMLFGNRGSNGKTVNKSKTFNDFNLSYNPYNLFEYNLGGV